MDLPQTASTARKKPRVRAHKPKVRTGCKTCKERRVKCDEERPACRRCIRIGAQCPGYQAVGIVDSFRDGTHKFYSIRARSSVANSESASTSPPLLSDHISHDLLFENEVEKRYFQVFRDQLAPELFTWNGLIWNRMILQASHNERFVRHGVVALAALVKAQKLNRALPQTHICRRFRSHCEFALVQYSKFIRLMRETLAMNAHNDSPRNAMLSALLVFSFEGLMGRRDRAIQHGQSGVNILHDWLARTAKTPLEEAGMVSPAPDIVEDELVQALGFMDVQVMNLVDDRPRAIHQKLMYQGSKAIQAMPSQFSNLREAGRYLEVLIRRNAHYLRATAGSSPEYVHATMKAMGMMKDANMADSAPIDPIDHLRLHRQYTNELKLWHQAADPLIDYVLTHTELPGQIRAPGFFMAIYAHMMDAFLKGVFSSNEMVYDEYKYIYRECLTLISQLTEILGSFGSSPWRAGNESVIIDAGLDICTQSSVDGPARNQSGDEAEVAEVSLSFDMCITQTIYLLCKRCRSPSIRRAAFAILRTFPYRDGNWDTGYTGAVVKAVMLLEEAGAIALKTGQPLPTDVPHVPVPIPIVIEGRILICGEDRMNQIGVQDWLKQSEGPEFHIPEEARVRVTRMEIETETKTAELDCERAVGGETFSLKISWT